jgi:integrase
MPGSKAAAQTWTVGRFLDFWLSKLEGRLRPTTVHGYRWIAHRYLIPLLGSFRLSKLYVRDVQRAVDQLAREGVRSGRLISPQSVHRVVAVLRSAMSEARRLGMIGYNPAWRLRLPAGTRPGPVLWDERRVRAWRETGARPRVATWDLPDLARFLDGVRDDWLFPLWWLVALRGPRRGEVAGLRWSDLDLVGKEMTISEQVIVVDGVEYLGPPKSAAGVRMVALDEVTVRILTAWREQLRRRGLLVPSGRVFIGRDGRPIRPDWLTRRFRQLVDELDLPPVRLHDLRHAAATVALAAGADLKVVQQQMGHSRAMTTLDTYAVVISRVAHEAAWAAARLLLSQTRLRFSTAGAYEA